MHCVFVCCFLLLTAPPNFFPCFLPFLAFPRIEDVCAVWGGGLGTGGGGGTGLEGIAARLAWWLGWWGLCLVHLVDWRPCHSVPEKVCQCSPLPCTFLPYLLLGWMPACLPYFSYHPVLPDLVLLLLPSAAILSACGPCMPCLPLVTFFLPSPAFYHALCICIPLPLPCGSSCNTPPCWQCQSISNAL